MKALLTLDRLAVEKMLVAAYEESGLEGMSRTLVAPALERIGDDWTEGKVSLSEVYMSSRICEQLVRPLGSRDDQHKKKQPKIAIAALQDYHLLGKKIVQLVLQSAGYELLDYGQGISVDNLVARVIKDRPVDVLLISTLMLPSALKVKPLREKLNQAGVTKIKIAVGGAPFRFDRELWREVGADASGITASDALAIVDGLSQEVTRAA